ncbi:MAG: YceD family protein [Methylovulum sp.]|nr:YceD family protein [Methylovulum sp.]
MLDRLPEYIDPLHLADKRGALKGRIPLDSLNRLADMLHNDEGSVAVELFFARKGRLAFCEGKIEAVLALRCQNCLGAVEWPVSSSVKLGIVSSIDQADKLSEDYEPLLVEEGNILLKDIIEDELLLVLPTFPKHQNLCFASSLNDSKAESLSGGDSSSLKNPFSILANLKNTGDL